MFGKIFFISLILHCNNCYANEISEDEANLKTIMQSNVVKPYIQVYKTFQSKIIDKLFDFDVNKNFVLIESKDNQTKVYQFVQKLFCNVRQLSEQLATITNSSYSIMKRIEEKIIPIYLSIENKQHEIREIELKTRELDISIANVTTLIEITRNSVKEKEKMLAYDEQMVKDAERKVDNAELCRNKRGLFGFEAFKMFPGLGNYAGNQFVGGLRDHVLKPICSLLNRAALDSARFIRDKAQEHLTMARNQLTEYENRLSENQKRKIDFETKLAEEHSHRIRLETAKNILYTHLNATTQINFQLKIALQHLKILSGRTIYLKHEIKHLIDFGLLIQPLNDVYDEFKNRNLLSEAIDNKLVLITENQLKNNEQKLNKLIQILPNLPMNTSENEIKDNDKSCDE